MQIAFSLMMFVVGACVGSFLCCQARRMRLIETKKQKLGKRSVCMHCGKKLSWRENLPIVSWIALRGKCKKCGKKIGWAEILSEIGIALMMLCLSVTIDVNNATLINWVIWGIMVLLSFTLGFLAIYDGLYGELPSLCLIFAGICAIIIVGIRIWQEAINTGFSWGMIGEILGSVAILGGLYLVLYLVSKGKWVGDGDYILAGIIGLVLGSPWLALVALFVANFLATLVMYPIVRKKKTRKIYFGPFLVIAFIVVTVLSEQLYGIISL